MTIPILPRQLEIATPSLRRLCPYCLSETIEGQVVEGSVNHPFKLTLSGVLQITENTNSKTVAS